MPAQRKLKCTIQSISYRHATSFMLDNRNRTRLPTRGSFSWRTVDAASCQSPSISRSLTRRSREFLSITMIGNGADTRDRKAIRRGTRTRRRNDVRRVTYRRGAKTQTTEITSARPFLPTAELKKANGTGARSEKGSRTGVKATELGDVTSNASSYYSRCNVQCDSTQK